MTRLNPSTLHAIIYLLMIASACAQQANPDGTTTPIAPGGTTTHNARDDMYGIGVRLGIYFQALAFLIGFANVLRLDPKSQFSGVVIAFTVLVRWFSRLHARSISTAELWVGLALLLLVSAPGMWLLFFTLEVQRRKWFRRVRDKRQAFGEVTKGQTLNILQALVVFLWTVVANSWFSYWIVGRDQEEKYPPAAGTRNVIWLGTATSVRSTWVKVVMVTQAALGTAFTAFPAFVYVMAVAFAMIAYWFPREGPTTPLLNTEDELDKKTRLETKRWAYGFGAVLFVMCLCLVLSVELTIKNARLRPVVDVQMPGQLLPLIAGAVSCVSSAADAFGRHIPVHNESRTSAAVGPYTDHRRGANGRRYVPLADMHGNEYNRDSVAADSVQGTHRRVGIKVYGAAAEEVRRDTPPGYERQSGHGFAYDQETPDYGRNPAYEPYRRLPR